VVLTPTRSRALLGGGLVLLTVAVFAPALGHDWLVYDDDLYITANPPLQLGWSAQGIAWAFTTFHGANWFPLTWLAWMLDYQLFGLDARAFHATSLLLHCAATLLLFAALVRMTGSAARSAFVAAVFAIHPLHVEPVAWAAGLKDPLSGLFFAAVLLVWSGCDGPRVPARRMALVFALLAAGLMAKPTLLTLPFVLLLLDAWPLGRLGRTDERGRLDPAALRRAVIEKWPLFLLVAAMSAVVFVAQRSAGAVTDLSHLPLSARLGNAVVAYATYVEKAFWPTGLAVFYPHPGAALPGWQVAASAAALLVLSLLALRAWRRAPALAVGWLWFLGMLVPMLGVVQVGSQARADRYTYLPLVGLAIAVAWGAPEAAALVLRDAARRRRVVAAAGCAALAALSVAASVQLGYWRDSEVLMRRALAVTRDNHIAHAYLGIALLQRHDVDGAIEQWRAAARIEPRYLTVVNNLAWLLATAPQARHRDPAEAVRLAERARRLAQDDPSVLDTLAAAYASAQRFDEARATAERALALAEARGDDALEAGVRERLALYRRGAPYVER
jgi:tetratricopeptide (TPR) repeat protein